MSSAGRMLFVAVDSQTVFVFAFRAHKCYCEATKSDAAEENPKDDPASVPRGFLDGLSRSLVLFTGEFRNDGVNGPVESLRVEFGFEGGFDDLVQDPFACGVWQSAFGPVAGGDPHLVIVHEAEYADAVVFTLLADMPVMHERGRVFLNGLSIQGVIQIHDDLVACIALVLRQFGIQGVNGIHRKRSRLIRDVSFGFWWRCEGARGEQAENEKVFPHGDLVLVKDSAKSPCL